MSVHEVADPGGFLGHRQTSLLSTNSAANCFRGIVLHILMEFPEASVRTPNYGDLVRFFRNKAYRLCCEPGIWTDAVRNQPEFPVCASG